ncbi:alanine racemase [Bacillus sp. EB01]|uniref:alanine racemase n=1 Tax=Bacillus sp. EB01 TaxID=1347086 RepID=UPI0005C58548|nr:alanine racemase [Bacillus sp. EB01]
MIQQSYRDTWAEISLEAITYNTEQFKKHIGENVKLMAVVKADGYGHGSVRVAKAALLAGAEYLAVALLDEALELRQAGINEPILVLGHTPARSVKKAILANIELTVFSEETLQEIINQSREMKRSVAVHLKIDTGMTRIGVQTKEEALALAKMCESGDNVLLKGIFTHFANADSEDPSYTAKQFSQFQMVVSFLEKHKIDIPFKHCCNTAATMSFPSMHLDMVRVGIGLYGLYPDASLKKRIVTLKQAMTLKTKIASLKIVPANQPISYGCTFLPPKESVIATLPIGYADGLSRLLSNRGQFLVKGQKAPIVGRVCMDQTMIDVTDIPSCQFDDEAVIFGQNGNAFQEIDEIARLMSTINYEVVCLVGKRVPRVYLESSRNSSKGSLGSSLLEYV